MLVLQYRLLFTLCSLSKLCARDFVPTGERVVATITTMMDFDADVRIVPLSLIASFISVKRIDQCHRI